MARIEALCVSAEKGQKKTPCAAVSLLAQHGIVGDAHAGPGHRQVSLLSQEDIDRFRAAGLPDLKAGDFAENIVVSGCRLDRLGLGSRIRLGPEATVRVSQIGKVCHHPCAIYRRLGTCLMPERGLFTTVVRAGDVRVSDRVEVTCRVDRGRPQAVVLLVSAGQPAGQGHARAVGRLLTRGLGAYVYEITPVPADPPAIRQALRLYSDGHSIDLVVAVGSSGVASSALQQAVESVAGAATPTADPAAGLDDWARAGGVVGVRQASLLLAIAAEPPAAAAALATALPGVRALLGQVCPRLSP